MKKLLKDNDIVNALKCCQRNEVENTCAYCTGCPVSDCEYEGDLECTEYLAQEILDLIHRLQEENKDLKEERENMQAEIFGLEEEKRQLQKQVDELKDYAEDIYKKAIDREEDAYSLGFDNGKKQAVKDTAKEICEMIDRTCISSKGYLCRIILKRYVVEVE